MKSIIEEKISELEKIYEIYASSKEELKDKEESDTKVYNYWAVAQLLLLVNGVIKNLTVAMEDIVHHSKKNKDEVLTDIMYLSTLVKHCPEIFTMVLETKQGDFLYDRSAPEWEDIMSVHKLIDFDKSSKLDLINL